MDRHHGGAAGRLRPPEKLRNFTGYPFGEIPDWLIRQRIRPPAWYDHVMPLGHRQD